MKLMTSLENQAIAATLELKALLEIDPNNRRGAWHGRLMTCLPQAIFSCGEPDIIFNSAGFTYYNLEIPTIDAEGNITGDNKRYHLPELIDTFLITEGVGIVLEARHPQQTIDMSYGDILGFHLHRTFAEPQEHIFQTDKPAIDIIREGAEIIIEQISEQILPANTLSLLEAVLQHFGVATPEIKLLYFPETQQHELIFSLEADSFSAQETQLLLQKLGWFLPRYYSYSISDLNNLVSQTSYH